MLWKSRQGAQRALQETILDLVMVGLIGVLLFTGIKVVNDNTVHEQKVVAHDWALARDAVLAARGNVEYAFGVRPGFRLAVDEECKVVVAAEGQRRTPQVFFCGKTKDARLHVGVSEKEGRQRFTIAYALE